MPTAAPMTPVEKGAKKKSPGVPPPALPHVPSSPSTKRGDEPAAAATPPVSVVNASDVKSFDNEVCVVLLRVAALALVVGLILVTTLQSLFVYRDPFLSVVNSMQCVWQEAHQRGFAVGIDLPTSEVVAPPLASRENDGSLSIDELSEKFEEISEEISEKFDELSSTLVRAFRSATGSAPSAHDEVPETTSTAPSSGGGPLAPSSQPVNPNVVTAAAPKLRSVPIWIMDTTLLGAIRLKSLVMVDPEVTMYALSSSPSSTMALPGASDGSNRFCAFTPQLLTETAILNNCSLRSPTMRNGIEQAWAFGLGYRMIHCAVDSTLEAAKVVRCCNGDTFDFSDIFPLQSCVMEGYGLHCPRSYERLLRQRFGDMWSTTPVTSLV